MLSDSEIESYHREGWLVPSCRLPEAFVDRCRANLDELIAQNPGVRPEKLISAHIETGFSSAEPGPEGVRGHRGFFELATHPLILDAVEQLIGPDIALWGCQVFCKPGGDGMPVPMHQDGEYWPIRPLATVTIWVALDRSDAENGCLRVVPRSHAEKKHFAHERREDEAVVLNQAIAEHELRELQPPVDVELEPGQFSAHDVHTVHGSGPNTSSRRRAGVAIRYMPTTSVLERELFASDASSGLHVDWKGRPIFLVRGEDKSGRNVFT
jgi:hypothetical protein